MSLNCTLKWLKLVIFILCIVCHDFLKAGSGREPANGTEGTAREVEQNPEEWHP